MPLFDAFDASTARTALAALLIGTACGLVPAVGSRVAHAQPTAHEEAYRIAILGCHRQDQPAPALSRYVQANPDLALWVGDNVYADTEDDPSVIDTSYAALAQKPAFRQLRRQTPTLATWDDHDYGWNNADKRYALKEESKAIFRRFWRLEDAIPAERDGIYHAETMAVGAHRLQVILLDVRYNRDRPSPRGDLLGARQWAWLEAQLRQPADLRLIVSGTQLLLDAASGSETWDQYPRARARLFETVRRAGAEGVVFITGDKHYAEVGRKAGALDVDAVELQFASVNQIEPPNYNSHRVAPTISSRHSYALLDVQMTPTAHNAPHLLFRVFDAMTDAPELIYRVNLDELYLDLTLGGADRFLETRRVPITHTYPDLDVRYTLDGTSPTAEAPRYTAPLTLTETTTVKARFFTPDGSPRSRVFERTYRRVAPRPARTTGGDAAGLRYTYYEGAFEQMPDPDTLAAVRRGTATTFDVAALAARDDAFAMTFEGWLQVPETGVYTLSTRSDDGSRLRIHGDTVVDNDGTHSLRLRSGQVALEAGWHPIHIDYFEAYVDQALHVTIRGPDAHFRPVGREASAPLPLRPEAPDGERGTPVTMERLSH
jgi:alkaline phosphatase D